MKPCRLLFAALMVGFLAAPVARGMNYHEIHTIKEPLGHTWRDELVHVDLDVGEDNVAADTFAVSLKDETRVPVQVEVLKGKPEAVRKVRLWLKVTLSKKSEVPLRITYNDNCKPAPQVEGVRATARDKGKDVVLSTGVAEVRLGGDAIARDPLPLDELPAVKGARPAGAKRWYGKWEETSKARFRRREVEIVERGPVRVAARVVYEPVEKGHSYVLEVRGVAGEPWIDVVESYKLPSGTRRDVRFAEGLRPREAFWLPWFVWDGERVRPVNDLRRITLAEKRGDRPFTTLRPRWTQARNSAQALVAIGSEGETPPCVGVLMTSPSDWRRPYQQMPWAKAEGADELHLRFPLEDGARHWAILAGGPQRFDSKGKFQHLMRAGADIPLDRILNEWIFDWKRDTDDPAPHILTTWPRLKRIREDFKKGRDTAEVRMIRRVLEGKAKGDKALAEFLAGKQEDFGGNPPGGGLYLGWCYQDDFFNPTTYPRRLKSGLRKADLGAAGRVTGGASTALLGYIFTDLDYWPGYAHGWGVGNPNFHTDMYSVALYTAALMPDHPHADRWMAFARDNLEDDVRRIVHMPGGAGEECPGYHAYALSHIVEMMQTVQNSGLGDPFDWPQVRATMEYLRNMHTPPDPRLGRRTLASIGDTHPWQDDTGALFGMVAAGMNGRNGDFAKRCMAMYRHYYGDAGSGDLVRDVLNVDQSIPAAEMKDMDWRSRAYPGFGAVLRSRFGTDRETFVTMKAGNARGHYQGDELSFHFYGAGRPMCLDWHCGYSPRPDQEHMHNRVNLGDNENMDAVGEMLAMATSDAADVAVGQVASRRLRKMPTYAHQIVWQASYPRRRLDRPALYRRYLMLVKHGPKSRLQDYLVVRDELVADEPATFNLWTLGREIEKKGPGRYRITGQLDTDLAVTVATPEDPKHETDRWAWPKRDGSSMIPKDFEIGKDRWRKGEVQQWLRVRARPGRPILSVLYPVRRGDEAPKVEAIADGRGVRVTLGEESEEVLLATDGEGLGGQAVVRRGGKRTLVLKEGEVAPLER